MTMTSFDTLKAAKSLQGAGFEVRQAEAMVDMVAHALSEGLATKEDVRGLKTDLAMLDNKIDTGLAALDNKIDTGLAALDNKIDTGLAALDNKIDTGLAALDNRIDTGLAALDNKIDTGLAALDNKIDTSHAALDNRIDTGLNNATQKLTIRLGGIVVGGIALLEILNRIFPVVPAP